MNPVCSQTAVRFPRQFAGSRSMASMLPSLLMTGLLTLVLTAVLRLLWIGYQPDFLTAWMEAWLTTWPIAFPLAYISRPLTHRLNAWTGEKTVACSAGRPGLHIREIAAASVETGLQPLKKPAGRQRTTSRRSLAH